MDKNFLISIISIILVSFFGNINTSKNVHSNYVFPIVWTILYVFLIICFKKVLDSKNNYVIGLFVLNLLLNVSWTYLYFSQKNIKGAFLNIILIIITSLLIYKENKEIRNLYIYYVLWLLFAGFLNYDSVRKIE
jgi:tryptophan-rich sensory protein